MMEMKGFRGLVAVSAVVMFFMLAAVEGRKEGTQKPLPPAPEPAPAPSAYKTCYKKCYSECNITKPLFCASLCVGKCKHGKSIPDNLCNCTYSCSKFKCANVGSDPEKIQGCVSSCSKLCTRNY